MPAPQISKRAKLERLLGFEPLLLTFRTAADCTSATARLCTVWVVLSLFEARLEALFEARLSARLESLSKVRLEALSKSRLSEMAMKLGAMLSAKLEAF